MLLVSLARDTFHLEIGAHSAVVLRVDEMLDAEGTQLAKHLHNRWLAPKSEEQFARLQIAGPLVVSADVPGAKELGPYDDCSMFDGVAYVDGRAFAFADVERHDWYVKDAGGHWKVLRVRFHRTGP